MMAATGAYYICKLASLRAAERVAATDLLAHAIITPPVF